MLDTARYTYLAEINTTAPPPENAQENELLRKAKEWNTHTQLSTQPGGNTNPEPTWTTTTTHPPPSPPNTRERSSKWRKGQRPNSDPANKQPPITTPNTGANGPHSQPTRDHAQQIRYTKSNKLLTQFRHAPRPRNISKHLHTGNDDEELKRMNEEGIQWIPTGDQQIPKPTTAPKPPHRDYESGQDTHYKSPKP